jgi:hypothetical protein
MIDPYVFCLVTHLQKEYIPERKTFWKHFTLLETADDGLPNAFWVGGSS